MTVAAKIGDFITRASMIRRMFEEGLELKKQFGPQNVYDFSLGNPDVPPPRTFKDALRQVLDEDAPGMHSYMPNAGYAETRQAVAKYLSGVLGKEMTMDHLVMTCGAGGALNVIFKTLLDPGDEVLVPKPCFVEYAFYADNAGGILKYVETSDDFSLDLNAVEAAVSEKTKAVLINSPNNPTGRIYSEEAISGLAEILRRKSRQYNRTIYLVSDEPYRDLVYDDMRVPSIFQAYANSILATSYSKTLSLAGERIGYLAINPDLEGQEMVMNGLVLSNRILGFVNAPALMQRVVGRLQGVTVDVDVYRKKRDLLCDGLIEAGYEVVKPGGAFYLFPKTPVPDDVAFVQALKRRRILTVPGSGFAGPGHFRIAYCVNDETIVNALEGFKDTMQDYR